MFTLNYPYCLFLRWEKQRVDGSVDDKSLDEWLDGRWIDVWMSGWKIGRCMDGWLNGWRMNRCPSRYGYGRWPCVGVGMSEKCMNGSVSGEMSGWVAGWVNRHTSCQGEIFRAGGDVPTLTPSSGTLFSLRTMCEHWRTITWFALSLADAWLWLWLKDSLFLRIHFIFCRLDVTRVFHSWASDSKLRNH